MQEEEENPRSRKGLLLALRLNSLCTTVLQSFDFPSLWMKKP